MSMMDENVAMRHSRVGKYPSLPMPVCVCVGERRAGRPHAAREEATRRWESLASVVSDARLARRNDPRGGRRMLQSRASPKL